MRKHPTEIWALLIVLGLGVLLAAILGLWGYMSVTATPLHSSPQDIPSVTSSAPSPEWADAVEQGRRVVRAALVEQNLPGLSVAVGAGGGIVWAEGFGWADLETQVKVAPDTQFRIGTASMPLTAAAVGVLLEAGALTLDDEIQRHVPDFPRKEWPVTLRQLMGHVSGVRDDAGDEEPVTVRCERTVDALPRFAKRPLLFEPGTRYHHSSYGWILVSAAVEAAAGEPFVRFVRRRVFEPLGMEDTTADFPAEPILDRATYYFPRFAADPRYGPQPPSEVDYSCFAGSSAFLSTPSDLVRFAMAIDGGKLLQPTTVHLLQTPERLASGQETEYGLGWDLETLALAGKQVRAVGHDGTLRDGMVSSFWLFRGHGIVVAVMSNISFADTWAVALKLAEAFIEHASRPGRR